MFKKVIYMFLGLLIGVIALVGFINSSANNEEIGRTQPPPTIVVETPTFEQIFPTPTIAPGSTVTVVPPNPDRDKRKSKTATPTATAVVFLVEAPSCPGDCMCLLVTQAVIANDLQRTAIANEINSCTKP